VKPRGFWRLVSIAVLLILGALYLFPYFWMVLTAVKPLGEFYRFPATIFPERATVQPFVSVMVSRGFVTLLRNSLVVCLAAVGIGLIVSMLIAYPITRLPVSPRFRRALLNWILSLRFLPPIVVVIPFFDIVRRAAHLVDKLVIAIGTHHDKHPLFTAAERVKLTSEVLNPVAKEIGLKLEVTTYDNLTVDAAKDAKATVVIRGLRDAGDFDYEMQMAGMNQALAPEIETVFLASSPGARHIAASLVRQIAAMGGDVSSFVPPVVTAALKKKFSG